MEKWWTEETVPVVTGANRGIGLQIVGQLASKGLTVVLTCRNKHLGLAATQSLLDAGLPNVHFHTLDVQSFQSVSDLAEWIKNKFGGLDIVINNAGVLGQEQNWKLMEEQGIGFRELVFHGTTNETSIFDYESARTCIDINYYGAKRVVKALLPLLRRSSVGSRIVNVSSILGSLQRMPNPMLRKQMSEINDINEEFVDSRLSDFLSDVKENKSLEEKGWPAPLSAYKMSKISLNAYTRLLARELRDQIYVNCVHPGYVVTELTSNSGDISTDEGAGNVVRVALFPPGGTSGQYFLEKEITEF